MRVCIWCWAECTWHSPSQRAGQRQVGGVGGVGGRAGGLLRVNRRAWGLAGGCCASAGGPGGWLAAAARQRAGLGGPGGAAACQRVGHQGQSRRGRGRLGICGRLRSQGRHLRHELPDPCASPRQVHLQHQVLPLKVGDARVCQVARYPLLPCLPLPCLCTAYHAGEQRLPERRTRGSGTRTAAAGTACPALHPARLMRCGPQPACPPARVPFVRRPDPGRVIDGCSHLEYASKDVARLRPAKATCCGRYVAVGSAVPFSRASCQLGMKQQAGISWACCSAGSLTHRAVGGDELPSPQGIQRAPLPRIWRQDPPRCQ